jgi:3-(3-hydroxy-phenyl)propionate hydroxylase
MTTSRSASSSPVPPSHEAEVDVVIVGAGPVGAMLANLLGQAGLSVAALEREIEPYPLPRAGATDDEVVRIFQAAGLADDLLPLMDMGQQTTFLSARGEPVATMRPEGTRNGHAPLGLFYQPDMERILDDGLHRFPQVAVHRGMSVEALHDDGDGVTVWARRGGRGHQVSFRSRYVVGCDGAHSTVRRLCAIPFGGVTYAQPWLVVDAKLDRPLETVPDFRFVGDPRRPAVTLPLPGTHHRWEFMVLPGDDPEDMTTLASAYRLISPWIDPERAQIQRHVIYTFHARTAERWRSGRTLLAGDAAHLMPPFAGQGLASGLRDAHNLAWKLATVLSGTAQPALLDSYERERRQHVLQMTRLTRVSGALVQTRSRRIARVRDVVLKKLARLPYFARGSFKPSLRYGVGAFARPGRGAASGRAFPQPMIMRAGRPALLDDIIGPGWALIGRAVDPGARMRESDAEHWRSLGANLIALCPPGQAIAAHTDTLVLEDLGGYGLAFLDTYDAEVVALRPDRIVFASSTARSIHHLTDLYRRLVGGPPGAASQSSVGLGTDGD